MGLYPAGRPASLPDLPESCQNNVDRGSITSPPSPNDCVCLVKQFIGSTTLSQRPLLVLTEGRAGRVGFVPIQKQPSSN